MNFSPRAIEAAARALCVQSGDDPDKLTYAHAMRCTGHDREPKFTWQYWLPFAEAALCAAVRAQLGRRDGYELAVQDIDLATGGDGEFKGSTIPGATVDVPAMKQRVIDRFVANASAEARLREKTLSLLGEIQAADESNTWSSNRNSIVKRAGWLAEALSAVGDEAKKSIPVQDAESASGAHVAGRTGGAHPPTGASPSDPTAERREIVAQIVREAMLAEPFRIENFSERANRRCEIAGNAADAILAALDGGAGA